MQNRFLTDLFAIKNSALSRAALAMLALLLDAPGASAALPVGRPWPNAPDRQAYNLVPNQPSSCPVRVHSLSGDVSNANAILCDSGGGLTLTMAPGGAAPRVVLDYGKNVGGIPWLDVGAVSGNPQLKVAYSETALHLDDNGDFAPALLESDGDSSRNNLYTVSAPGLIANRYTQGGERFQVVTLTSPGSVTLRGAGIQYIADRTQAADYAGYFLSSDDELNRVWYASVYTAQLNAVPTASLPGSYRIENGALSAWGSNPTGNSVIGYYKPGANWTDYTMAFDLNIVPHANGRDQQAGWTVRTRDAQNGVVFLLSPGLLRAFKAVGNQYTEIGSQPVAAGANAWHHVATSVSGATATVNIDNLTVLTVSADAFGTGSVGFRQWGPEEARFRNLRLTDRAGASLLNLPLNDAAQLRDFHIPGVNEVPSILDGAKRDRAVWSGDLDTEGAVLAYSLGNNDYLKGGLQLLATHQHGSGFIEGVVPPAYPLLRQPLLANETGPYSAVYSMYFVIDLYDHLMYSGERAFAASLWPVVTRQMAWNATRLDARGLFITRDRVDGADWDFYDPDKAGAITAYNVMYYRTLVAAAAIGDAVGQGAAAAAYRGQAAKLRDAINTHMYDGARGVYRISDTVPVIAQDANALAVLAGVPAPGQAVRVLASMKTALWTNQYGPMPFNDPFWKPIVSTFMSGYEAQARYLANDAEHAEQLIHTVFGRLANPLNYQYTGTMWENVGADGTPGLGRQTSLAHGWATGAATALSAYALGILPTAPGFDTWLVQPHPGTLDWAVGQAPTPHGALQVKWGGKRDAAQFTMEVVAPGGSSGTVAVPTYGAGNPVVTVNERVVWRNGGFLAGGGPAGASTDGQFVYLNGIQAGSYLIATGPAD